MKKIFLLCTPIMLLTAPSTATPDIAANAGSASCVEPTLHRYTGTANLQAGWEANHITLSWYNGDQQITPTNNAATACDYSGSLTIPTNAPTKTGYTFRGWKIRTASSSSGQCFTTYGGGLTASLADIGIYESDGSDLGVWQIWDITGEDTWRTTEYGLTAAGQWASEFSYGTVKGVASCNNTLPSGVEAFMEADDAIYENENMTPEEQDAADIALYNEYWGSCDVVRSGSAFNSSSSGQYCWCKLTSYTPTGGSQYNFSSPSWVLYSVSPSDNCVYECAQYCASAIHSTDYFRHAMYRAAGN